MKISAIPVGANAIVAAAAARTNNNNKIDLPTNNYNNQYGAAEKMTQPKHAAFPNAMQKKRRDSSTNSSFCSACTESDDSDSSLPSANNQQRSRKTPTTPKRKPQKNGMPKPIAECLLSGGQCLDLHNFSISIPIAGTGTNDDGSASSAASASDTSDDDSDDSDDDTSESDTTSKQNQKSCVGSSAESHNRQSFGLSDKKRCPFSAERPKKTKSLAEADNQARRPEILGADGASSSDMELPALVSAAIQRVAESGSDGEIVRPVHYTSSLLRDFVAKTQMLGSSTRQQESRSADTPPKSPTPIAQTTDSVNAAQEAVPAKKKRGRPRKNQPNSPSVAVATPAPTPAPATATRTSAPKQETRTNANQKGTRQHFSGLPQKKNSQSPDSGIITSTPHSPVPNGLHEAQKMAAAAAASGTGRVGRPPTITKAAMKQQAPMPKKLDIARLEKCMYATERVLYPPRRKKRSYTPRRSESLATNAVEDVPVDPVWRKIDINKKFRRPSTCGYKSDGGNTICSKVLAAQSGYISDYGNVKTRHLSGYKSDYSCKSRRSGYKSDFSVKAKSCGYRSDCSTRHRRKIRRKRRTKTASSSTTYGAAAKSTVNDLDILQLAGLSLGQSEESSRDSNSKDEIAAAMMERMERIGRHRHHDRTDEVDRAASPPCSDGPNSSGRSTAAIIGRMGMDDDGSAGLRSKFNVSTNALNADVYKEIRANAIKLDGNKPAMIRRRRSSAVSHCSSRCSTISRHPFRRRRRKRLKSRSDLLTEPNSAKINMQIEALVNSFSSQCSIYAEKTSSREKETPAGAGVGGGKGGATKRVVKKRKGTTDNDKEATTSTATSKRRHKKAVQTKSPDDHKLPLKKRHYLLTPGEKSENKSSSAASLTAESEKNKSVDEQSKASADAGAAGKAVTPKKRQFLETPNEEARPTDVSDASGTTKESAKETIADAKTSAASKRVDTVARKKTRLEGVLSKIQPASASTAAPTASKDTTAKTLSKESAKSHPKETAKPHTKDPTKPRETAKIQPKEIAKSQPKETSRSQSKETAKSQTKETLKSQTKETAKLQTKETAKAQLKEMAKPQTKEMAKTQTKETAKSQPKDISKSQTKETAKPQTKETPKSQSKETPKSQTKEMAKPPTKETGKPQAKEAAKLQAKETAKSHLKETTKSTAKESAKPAAVDKISKILSILAAKETASMTPTPTTTNQSVMPQSTRQQESRKTLDATQSRKVVGNTFLDVRTTTHEPMASPPPGVFVSTIDLELQIPFTSISTTAMIAKDRRHVRTDVVEKLLNRTGGHLLLKRKRKKPNRTGFPTLKKKKKKPAEAIKLVDKAVEIPAAASSDATAAAAVAEVTPEAEITSNAEAKAISTAATKSNTSQSKKVPCDRVPSEGEPTATFIERNSRPRLSVVSLDRLQGKEETESPVGNKRTREASEEKSQSNRKRHKNDRLGALEKEKRDHSSDNEPLINFVQKKTDTAAKVNDKRVAVVKLEVMKTLISDVKSNQKVNVPERRGRNAVEKGNEKAKTPPPVPVAAAVKTSELMSRRRRESICIGKIELAKRRIDDSADVGTRRGNRRKEVSSLSLSPSLENSKKRSRLSQPKEASIEQQIEKIAPTIDPSGQSSQSTTEPKTKLDRNLSSKATESGKEKATTTSTKKSASESSLSTQTRRSETKSANKRDDVAAKEKTTKPRAKLAVADATASKEKTENDNKSDMKEKENNEQPIDAVKAKKGQDKSTTKSDLRSVRKETTTTTTTAAANTTKPNGPSDASVAMNDEDISYATNVEFDETDYVEHDPLPIEESENGVEATSVEIGDNRKALSRPKKRYLTAGLFSNYYKENHPSGGKSSSSSSSTSLTSAKADEVPSPAGSLLPPPTYCERYLRRTVIDFCLPWDLWNAHENGKLPGRNIVHSWNFKKIRTNVYCDVRANPSTDLPQCSCKPDTNCGDNCLNRLVYTECSPETCPCRESCQNTKIQRHMIAPGVERFMTQQKGWGVQTKMPIKKGTYILEYVGEVVTEREFKERMATLYTSDIHHYCLHLDGGLVIDGHRMGSDCRFVNHSCAPNCEMQKWSVNGLSRMALFAMRDIEPGEELTYDYNFSLFNPSEGQPCKCESEQCRGVIGGKSQRVRPIESNKVSEAKPNGPHSVRKIYFFFNVFFHSSRATKRYWHDVRVNSGNRRKATVQRAKDSCMQRTTHETPFSNCRASKNRVSWPMDTASFCETCERYAIKSLI